MIAVAPAVLTGPTLFAKQALRLSAEYIIYGNTGYNDALFMHAQA